MFSGSTITVGGLVVPIRANTYAFTQSIRQAEKFVEDLEKKTLELQNITRDWNASLVQSAAHWGEIANAQIPTTTFGKTLRNAFQEARGQQVKLFDESEKQMAEFEAMFSGLEERAGTGLESMLRGSSIGNLLGMDSGPTAFEKLMNQRAKMQEHEFALQQKLRGPIQEAQNSELAHLRRQRELAAMSLDIIGLYSGVARHWATLMQSQAGEIENLAFQQQQALRTFDIATDIGEAQLKAASKGTKLYLKEQERQRAILVQEYREQGAALNTKLKVETIQARLEESRGRFNSSFRRGFVDVRRMDMQPSLTNELLRQIARNTGHVAQQAQMGFLE